MSSTLNWASSGNAAKTGTTVALFMADIVAMITAQAGNAAFNWQVAGSSIAATPFTIVLSRKDASAGRIGIICLTSAFTNIQPVLWEQLPAINNVFIAYFPQGTGSTLSNLNATSGTVCGVDTNAPFASSIDTVATVYGASVVPYYFDSYDAIYLQLNNPAATTEYTLGAGELVEDGSGTTYPSTLGTGTVGWSTFNAPVQYQTPSAKVLAGALPNSVQANYLGTKKQFYCPFSTLNSWSNLTHSSVDSILADDANSKVWFAPVPLMSQTRGEGAILKFRQLGWGPGQTSAFFKYSTTGPVVQAQMMSNVTAGQVSAPYLTNFKI